MNCNTQLYRGQADLGGCGRAEVANLVVGTSGTSGASSKVAALTASGVGTGEFKEKNCGTPKEPENIYEGRFCCT